MPAEQTHAQRIQGLYAAVRRWHFAIGLLVIPFLLMLAASGLLMLLSKPLDDWTHRHLLNVEPTGDRLSAESLLQRVRRHFPDAPVLLYLPPFAADQSARFTLKPDSVHSHGGHDAPTTLVYVNPHTGDVLGTLNPATSLYAQLKTFHGSLYLGNAGDTLIEIAAGLAVLMIVTGLYLGWPRNGWRDLLAASGGQHRANWRLTHLGIGWLIAAPLLFFLISGLAWTNVWGGKLVQPWGSLPGTQFKAAKPAQDHASMNQHGAHQVPWALEQTPLPQSEAHPHRVPLSKILEFAQEAGFTRFRVHFPQNDNGVWTVSATTIAGDILQPSKERILHIDQSTGRTLADIRYADYPALGMAMAASIPFHQGDLGVWNWLLNLLLVTLVLALIVTGTLLWWKRRPRLTASIANPGANKTLAGLLLVVSLCFPLSALTLAVLITLDTAIRLLHSAVRAQT